MSPRQKTSKLSVLISLSLVLLINNTYASEVILSRLENFDTCGGEFTGYQYTITSPNYPNNYSENQDCVYKLHGSPFAKCNQIFHVQFLNFTLRSSKNCQQDYLSIDDRSFFCGSVIGVKSFSSKNNTLKLQFHSDNGSDKGFKLLITTLPCSTLPNSLHKVAFKQPTTKFAESVTNHPSIDYEKVYPVYRPNNVFSTEDVKSINNIGSSPKVTAYFYQDPEFYSVDKSEKLTPSSLESLPKPESAYYTNIQNLTKLTKSKSSVDNNRKFNEKLIVPYNSYGVPAGKPYAPLPGFSPAQIQTGEVLEIERDNIDCDGKVNIPNIGVPLSEQPFDNPPVFDDNYPSVVSPGINSYPATTYGAPGSPIPPPPVANVPFNPTDINYNDNGFRDPFLITPRPNFDDNVNINNNNNNNNNNNFIPSTNIVGAPEVRQCCNNQYNSPRFLITSPGFPSLFYSSNYYDCIYTINPLPNACRLRINFKYFNHGLDEAYCPNGFVEIDGRKYCGCKTGLTLVVNVFNYQSKFIRVRYSGYPRTKFGGFVFEVTQEFPSGPYNNYPYLSRSKKSAENLTKTEILSTGRTKRELGYFYPKPNIVFNEHVPGHREIGNVVHGFVSHAACLALNFASWTLASKEVYSRGARCFWNNGNGLPGVILYPSGGNNGCLSPNNNCLPQNNNCLPPNNNCSPQNNCLPPNINCLPTNNLPGPINPPTNPGYLPPGPNYPNNNENIDVPPVSVVPNYPNSGNGAPSGNCKLVSVKEGIISSPLYPSDYQNNLNVCYRFVRAPNHCRLQISILDFDLENSLNCIKDFVIFGNQFTRYCGRSVAGSKTLLSFPRNDIIDVRFVTDSYGTARGFNIAFSQVSCTLG
ncbi:GSCOCG00004254001-RA-CDS [Cotesia congregata]|uniref:Similar to Cubn: Cubilin (Rattus norvegicus) n=1 Tax=Cotesia congregata TaxID=51543 RepID=A0A8J2HR09_COTCN|nr:GSCOCG00004254001-RA-CDS [Cotesia congregata]CAG5109033.1 Similar to Cubn: Cubilin (Rattus norvegicus) [Cotesia congregata]